MDMLNRAVEALRAGKIPDRDTPLEPVSQEVNLHVAALIPEDYLPDAKPSDFVQAHCWRWRQPRTLDDLKGEIIDRFGSLPISVQNLFQITEIKLQAQHLGILKVDLATLRASWSSANHPSRTHGDCTTRAAAELHLLPRRRINLAHCRRSSRIRRPGRVYSVAV